MEKNWILEARDGTNIYGVLNSSDKNTKKAIFLVHGLNRDMHEYAFKRAADYFSENYDVYRFNLYDGREKGRALIDCTLQTHADDLDDVLNHYAGGYESVFLIGHSYGGPTVILANPRNITAVSLWDPSFDLKGVQSDFSKTYIEKEDCYSVNWGTSYLIGKEMYYCANKLDKDACIKLAQEFQHPVQVIHAGNGYYVNKDVSYHSYGNSQNIREVVSGTVHFFYEGNSCDELLQKTRNWFSKF